MVRSRNFRLLSMILKRAGFLVIGGIVCLSSGCNKPGNWKDNLTNSFVTVTAINDNKPFQSDILTHGYAKDDVVTVKLKSEFRAPKDDPTAPDGPSVFDTIVFHSYQVAHSRSDGGPNPASFTVGINLKLPSNSEAEASIVLVRAFDKNRSPLEELRDDGEIFATAVVTFYGSDGNGNDLAVSAAIAISYANFPDQ
jgi:hypothetical protein